MPMGSSDWRNETGSRESQSRHTLGQYDSVNSDFTDLDSLSKRERILKIAARVFAEKGFDATGVAELGDAVGLGRGSLYHYIGSKQELLYEISVRYVEQLVAYAEGLLDAPQPADLRLRNLSRQLMTVIWDYLPEITVFFRDFGALSDERRDEINAIRQRFDDAVWNLLQQGVEEGIFVPVSRITVKAFLGMHNYSYLWLQTSGPLTPQEIADHFCDIFLGGVSKRT